MFLPTAFLLLLVGCLTIVAVHCNSECLRHTCDKSAVIACNNSMVLLVTDVTNGRLNRSKKTFEDVKQKCMGRKNCSLPSSCNSHTEKLFVHYFCVNSSHIRSKNCSNRTPVKDETGFIQSQYYPGYIERMQNCSWRLEAPKNSVMVLSLHDLVISGGSAMCENGLKVTGSKCDQEQRVSQTITLCTFEDERILSVIRCNQVVIELSSLNHSMKFWMSFHTRPRPQTSLSGNVLPSPLNFQASLLPCSGWIYYMDTGTFGQYPHVTSVTTQGPVLISQGSNTELLIIMLSIISGFSAVLLVILVVVCIRCRLLQTTHTEYLYTEAGSGLHAHNQYISSLENEKPRPHLADGYYEVADAIPPSQRGATPTSPAYAEVENLINLRKGPWTEEDIKISKPFILLAEDRERMQSAENRNINCRLKLDTKPESCEDETKLSSRSSTGPVVIATTLKRSPKPDPGLATQNKAAGGHMCNSLEDDGSSAYEPIAVCNSEKIAQSKVGPFSSTTPATSKLLFKSVSNVEPQLEGRSKTLNRVRNRTSSAQERAKQFEHLANGTNIQSGESQRNLPKAPTRINVMTGVRKSDVLNIQDGSKTLPNKNSKRYLEIHSMKNNNYKYSECSDLQGSKSIVRNGIKLFENNNA